MRDLKELLIILLDNVEELMGEKRLASGLCWTAWLLYRANIINGKEESLIDKFINLNMPEYYASPYDNFVSSYGWKRGAVEPRIKWLNEQIEKL